MWGPRRTNRHSDKHQSQEHSVSTVLLRVKYRPGAVYGGAPPARRVPAMPRAGCRRAPEAAGGPAPCGSDFSHFRPGKFPGSGCGGHKREVGADAGSRTTSATRQTPRCHDTFALRNAAPTQGPGHSCAQRGPALSTGGISPKRAFAGKGRAAPSRPFVRK